MGVWGCVCEACPRDRGCRARPAFPAPSCSRGTTSCAKLGTAVSREHGFLCVSGEAPIKLNGPTMSLRGALLSAEAPPSGEGGCDDRVRRSSTSEGGSNPFFLLRGPLDCFAHQSRIRATIGSQCRWTDLPQTSRATSTASFSFAHCSS